MKNTNQTGKIELVGVFPHIYYLRQLLQYTLTSDVLVIACNKKAEKYLFFILMPSVVWIDIHCVKYVRVFCVPELLWTDAEQQMDSDCTAPSLQLVFVLFSHSANSWPFGLSDVPAHKVYVGENVVMDLVVPLSEGLFQFKQTSDQIFWKGSDL